MYLKMYRNSRSQMFFKIGVLKNFAKFTAKHLSQSLFLIKLQTWKETLAQVFSREFKKIFKNYFFYRTTPVAVSECICPICIYSFSEAALKKMFLKFGKINMKTTVFESLSQYSGRPLW